MTYSMSVPTQQSHIPQVSNFQPSSYPASRFPASSYPSSSYSSSSYTDLDNTHLHTELSPFTTPRSFPSAQEQKSPSFYHHQEIYHQDDAATTYRDQERRQEPTHLSISLDATVLRSWRDTSEYSSTSATTYYCSDLMISSFSSPENRVLARYTGGKLKKDALYQLRGRLFFDVDGSANGTGISEKSYLHIDEAVRFQGPGELKSFRFPMWRMEGECVDVAPGKREGRKAKLAVRWRARDEYRRGLAYEQTATMKLERGLEMQEHVGKTCAFEGRMEGLGASDWICTGMELC